QALPRPLRSARRGPRAADEMGGRTHRRGHQGARGQARAHRHHAGRAASDQLHDAARARGEECMTEAFIYDAVRTPRGRGKKDGGLHQATPVWLLRTLLNALQARNRLDTALVDDVVLGCVTPIGEQGADIARTAVLDAEWAQTVAGVTLS